MRAMIYRNLILSKRLLYMVPLYILVFFIIVRMPLSVCIGTLNLAAYFFIITLFTYEGKEKATAFNKALPVKNSDVVAAYYLSLCMSLMYALVLLFIGFQVYNAISSEIITFDINNYMIAMSFVIVTVSVQLPLVIRFGDQKMKLFNMIFFLIVFGLTGALAAIEDMINIQHNLVLGIFVMAILIFFLSYVISTGIYAKKEDD